MHEELLRLGDESTLIGAAQQAGLDLDRFQADWHDAQIAQPAQASHAEAAEKKQVFGTPTLVFPSGNLIHLELSEIPPETDALETFQTIETLAVQHPYTKKLTQMKIP